VLDALAALVPPVGVGLLFWFVVRAIVGADRRERAAMAALDRQERDERRNGENAPAPDRSELPD
jgi:hypothetical protein